MKLKKVPEDQALALSKKKRLELLLVFDELCKQHQLTYWIDSGTLLGAMRHGGFIPWDDDIDVCLPKKDYTKALDILLEYTKADNPYLLFYRGSGLEFCYDNFGDSRVIEDGTKPVRIDMNCVKYVENTPEALAEEASWASVASVYLVGKVKHPEWVLEKHSSFLPKKEEEIIAQNNVFFQAYMAHMEKNMELAGIKEDLLLDYAIGDSLIKRNRAPFKYADVFPLGEVEFEGKHFPAPGNPDAYLRHSFGDYHQLPPENEQRPRMTFLAYSSVNKWKWDSFLKKFLKEGLRNMAIGSEDQIAQQAALRKKSFVKLAIGLFLKGHFAILKGLIWYAKNKLKGIYQPRKYNPLVKKKD